MTIGAALVMFYLTSLSQAEHVGFLRAYLAAAGLNIAPNSGYAGCALRSASKALFPAALLGGAYAALYTLLRLEDYALLAGTGVLLGLLGVPMFLTRNLNADSAAAVPAAAR